MHRSIDMSAMLRVHTSQPLNSINRLEGASLRAVARWPEARGRPYWQGHVIVVYLNLNLMNNGLEKQSLLVAHILPEIIQFPFE